MTRLLGLGAIALAAIVAQQNPGTFPAMQRKAAAAETVARGRAIFGVNCVACHGADARGGQLNGPNLLRSQLVLGDHDGERIAPVIHDGRPERGMPAFPLGAEDVTALVEFLHSLTAASPGQGAPPPTEQAAPDIVVGDAAAGQRDFGEKCSACHAAEGDLRGVASRAGSARILQALWVSGGQVTRRGRDDAGAPAAAITATIVLPSGERIGGRVAFIDDFEIKIRLDDGTVRGFRRDGGVPTVELHDPLDAHKALWSTLTDRDMRDVTAYLVTLK